MPFKNPHPLYGVWQGMRRRCLTPTYRQWDDYGGRGISICPQWDSFDRFVKDMGPRPEGHSLDRIDNDGNYEPSNCRWASRIEQQRNQRRTRKVTIDGVIYCASELAHISGLKADSIVVRAALGLSYAEVMAPEKRISKRTPIEAIAVRVANQRNATHCKHGHEWTPENTYISPQGWKRCKACERIKTRRLNAKKRATLSPGL